MDKTGSGAVLEGLWKKAEPASGQAEFSGFSESPDAFISPPLSPRHRQHTPAHVDTGSQGFGTLGSGKFSWVEHSFIQPFIHPWVFFQCQALCRILGIWSGARPGPRLRAGSGGCWALRSTQCGLISAMHSFAHSTKAC